MRVPQHLPQVTSGRKLEHMNTIYITGKIISDIVRGTTKKAGIPAMNFRLRYLSGDIQCYVTVSAYGSIADSCDFNRGDVVFIRGKLMDDKKYNVGVKAYEWNRIR